MNVSSLGKSLWCLFVVYPMFVVMCAVNCIFVCVCSKMNVNQKQMFNNQIDSPIDFYNGINIEYIILLYAVNEIAWIVRLNIELMEQLTYTYMIFQFVFLSSVSISKIKMSYHIEANMKITRFFLVIVQKRVSNLC